MKSLDTKTLDQLLNQLDDLIKSGNIVPVKKQLDELRKQKIPRPHILKIASLARRVGYQRMAEHLLSPIVRPQKPIHPIATAEELIEYAINIMRLGIVGEALKILSGIDENKYPDVYLYKSFCYFAKWEYEKSIPLLEQHLKTPKISAYQVLVSKINLASAYINSEKHQKAKTLLNDILRIADSEKNKLILGNAHELLAEYYINQHQQKNAEKHIAVAQNLLSSIHYRYEIYNKKWSAIAKLLNSRTKNEGFQLLARVRSEALEKKLYEVLRECDFYEAILTHNEVLLRYLYFGTPHEKFRERILQNIKEVKSIPKNFVWFPNGKNNSKLLRATFDVQNGVDINTGRSLKRGSLVHKLLQILCSDFYRPFKVLSLFNLLFPKEYYNSLASDRKIHDLIFRLRNWLDENSIPLVVVSTGRGEFQIKTLKPYGLIVTPFIATYGAKSSFIQDLKVKWSNSTFSCKQVIMLTGFSRTKAKRFLSEAVKDQILITKGKGRGLRYCFYLSEQTS